ncbi:MAG: 3-deoxy-D-manno-octulosonate 8-phosphate phosphatase YrbI family [Ignavibacteria bacterium]|nr:MAG: 3-deoxy-D-manno-octulosonate 8-phosphate phosphatase YrbI family [Ignavibacteria bacterium]KAF0159856.1 MAG: 3-deoxy-D-manno-octulosonate 8-phosphate phosphatase YrbI family [Ignavibacteria bacterium]
MKIDILTKIRDIKLFLFDLEGVLIHKNAANCIENIDKFIHQINIACEEFTKHKLKFGIVTASNENFLEKIKTNSNCIVLSNSINKVQMVDDYLKHEIINYKQVLYIGDDILDIPLLQKVGISGAPKDGRREVKRVVNFITKSNSGEVLPEILDYLKQTKK